ncbi:hypothetical protein [Aureicoccus marinus]|uniref:Uncharacterized protein n=1 Tax=Aureicoccus marinus TaxID=754435 RepID=A0A2S7T907_9FLAO|nr:hypothetical protein [Aureicoccus marinus]PQJ15946.1 hypothetical protein BST99_09610 [Aureicoccus marinus]
MRRTLLLILFLCLFISCSKHHGEIYSFQGEIGKKIGVTGTLEINRDKVTGSYHYNIFKRSVRIEGAVEGDRLSYRGIDPDGKLIDYFDGYINEDNSISGVWKSADGQRSMPFFYTSTVQKSYLHYFFYAAVILAPVGLFIYSRRKYPSLVSFGSRTGNKSRPVEQMTSFDEVTPPKVEKSAVKVSYNKAKGSGYTKSKRRGDSRTLNDKYSSVEPLEEDEAVNEEEESVRKGKAFERYVQEGFDSRYYKWLESRSDDRYGHDSPESNKYPDFVFSLKYKEDGLNNTFAIECKYRSNLQKVGGMYRLFDARQLSNYLKYSQRNNYPTFVILGVGGEPSGPESIYIIPLESLENLKGKYEESVGIRSADLSSYLKTQYRNFRFFPSSQGLG